MRALRHVGATVLRINEGGAPDLLVGHGGKNTLIEVKRPPGPKGGTSHSELTPDQEIWHREWRGTVHVVRTPSEALQAIGHPAAAMPEKKARKKAVA